MLSLVIINIIHFCIVVFIILAPFFGNIPILTIHISSVISILTHWSYNNDTCFLTLIETSIRNIEKTESFMHKIVSPVYKFSEIDINNISYISLSVFAIISIIKLYNKVSELRARNSLILRDII